MKINITYTNWGDSRQETLENLEDLKKLIEKEGHSLIINTCFKESECDFNVEVYNDYRE